MNDSQISKLVSMFPVEFQGRVDAALREAIAESVAKMKKQIADELEAKAAWYRKGT